MTKRGRPSTGKELILAAATELFFTHGYQRTGISDIIEKAGVSKPTFYAHFDSKEALCIEYLRSRQAGDLRRFEEALAKTTTPLEAFFVPFQVLEEVQTNTDFRGCPYFNMVSEMGEEMPLVREEVMKVSNDFLTFFNQLSKELLESDRSRFSHLKDFDLAALYNLLFNGAITLSQESKQIDPVKNARAQMALILQTPEMA